MACGPPAFRATYYTLDDAALLSAATRDADAFLRSTAGPIVIDAVQLAPDLFPAIKIEVDRHRTRGRFLPLLVRQGATEPGNHVIVHCFASTNHSRPRLI